MSKKIYTALILFFLIILVSLGISFLEKNKTIEEVDVVKIAEENIFSYVKTFTERGGNNLEKNSVVNLGDDIFEVSFTFNSDFSGYGKIKEGEMSAQMITEHIVVLTLKEGKAMSIITDNVYDEIKEDYLEKNEEFSFDVFFLLVEGGEETVIGLKRTTTSEFQKEEESLLKLLEGLTEEEKSNGYFTAINENTKINSFFIEEGIAYVDFTKDLDVAGGSAMVLAIYNQIEKTLLQFDTIEEVVISIEGEREEILQP